MVREDVNVQLPAGAVLPVSPSAVIAAAVDRGALTEDRAQELLAAAADGEDTRWVAQLWGGGRPLGGRLVAAAASRSPRSASDDDYFRLYPESDPERARAEVEAREAEQAKLARRFGGYVPDPAMRMPDHDGQ